MPRANISITTLEAALDLAVWLERQGEAYYQQAAASTDDADLTALCQELAAQERQHCATYQHLYAEVTGKDSRKERLLGEYGHFINLLIGEVTRYLGDVVPTNRAGLLTRALQFEKDSLIYFKEIRELFGPPQQTIIDRICSEEKRHIAQLLELAAPKS